MPRPCFSMQSSVFLWKHKLTNELMILIGDITSEISTQMLFLKLLFLTTTVFSLNLSSFNLFERQIKFASERGSLRVPPLKYSNHSRERESEIREIASPIHPPVRPRGLLASWMERLQLRGQTGVTKLFSKGKSA